MPVRSLNSSLLAWPDIVQVHAALHAWAAALQTAQPQVRALGYFGSYARGDWGVGSDLDILVLVEDDERPFERRGFPAENLPVPADVLVYTLTEWAALEAEDNPFYRRLASETRWILER